jgi:ring-1,2-phenylacetyl-CoA epoxidase subunit PaaC
MTSRSEVPLALGDDALVMSQRLVEWVARAPEIEEDVALANIALDLLGQARMLLTHAGSLMDPVRTEDDLAYWRDAGDFRNAVLVERENGDFAVTMTRLLLFSAYQCELYDELRSAEDPTLAAIAAKALPEVRYHRDHARLWVLRLGDGTEESHRRMTAALDAEWPWFPGLGAPAAKARAWVTEVLVAATLTVTAAPEAVLPDGRRGEHTPALVDLLAELQVVARAHAGASW